jgi:type II secretory pathway component PulK
VLAEAIKRFRKNYEERKILLSSLGAYRYIIRSGGYVLIMVLIITTLLVSLSGDFLITSQTNIGYIRKFSKRLQALHLAKSGIELGKVVLQADKDGSAGNFFPGKSTDKNIDSYKDIWAMDFPAIPFENGTIKIKITDENSKINLSILANEFVDKTTYYGITQRFFMNMGLSVDFADIIIDWVDIDDSSFPYGAESGDYYMSLEDPYPAKNKAMDSIDEMLLLKDMTPEIYYGIGGGNSGLENNLVPHNRGDISSHFDLEDMGDMMKELGGTRAKEIEETDEEKSERSIGKEKNRRLSDYFRAQGKREVYNDELNKININTASYRVLSSLTDDMTDDIVTAIITQRLASPFKSVDGIKELIGSETFNNLRSNILSVKSYIFKIESTAKVVDTKITITAIYNRSNKKILYWSEE